MTLSNHLLSFCHICLFPYLLPSKFFLCSGWRTAKCTILKYYNSFTIESWTTFNSLSSITQHHYNNTYSKQNLAPPSATVFDMHFKFQPFIHSIFKHHVFLFLCSVFPLYLYKLLQYPNTAPSDNSLCLNYTFEEKRLSKIKINWSHY